MASAGARSSGKPMLFTFSSLKFKSSMWNKVQFDERGKTFSINFSLLHYGNFAC